MGLGVAVGVSASFVGMGRGEAVGVFKGAEYSSLMPLDKIIKSTARAAAIIPSTIQTPFRVQFFMAFPPIHSALLKSDLRCNPCKQNSNSKPNQRNYQSRHIFYAKRCYNQRSKKKT